MRRFLRVAAVAAAFVGVAAVAPAASASDSTSQVKPIQQIQGWTAYDFYLTYSQCVWAADTLHILGFDVLCEFGAIQSNDGTIVEGWWLYTDPPV